MNLSHCAIIAITNQKGGVGKTTTAMNVSSALQRQGLRVLAVDCDPHGNLTQGFGFSIQSLLISLSDLIMDRSILTRSAVLKTPHGVDLIGANPELAKAGRWMVTQTNGELRLAQRLRELRSDYDVILLDSCPGLGTLLNSVLNTADYLMIPVDTGFYGYMGVQELQNEIEEIKLGTNPKLEVLGFVLTMSDRTVITRETWDALVTAYGDLVFETPIRRCVSLRESPATGQSIFDYAPESIGAQDYLWLAHEITERLAIKSSRKNEVSHV